VSFAPESETELARVIAFLDESGDRAGALAAYDEFARRLEAEYDANPSPETQALIREVRARTRPATSTPPRVTTAHAPIGATVSSTPESRPRRSWRPLVSLAVIGLLLLSVYSVVIARHRGIRSHIAVAVVPIQELTGDTALARLADGMTDELITDLAQVRTLDVINRRTMMTYRGSKKSAEQIARERSADAVLVSGMRQAGDTVHMTVQLYLAGKNRAAWAKRYAVLPGELPQTQRDVARAVADRVGATLGTEEHAGLAPGRAVEPAALSAYIRARYWWDRRSRENLLKAVRGFQQALDLDPTFAAAYSGMGDAYAQLGYGGYLRPDDAFPKARAAANKALELDSTLAEPHATLGFSAMYFDWDWRIAEREYRQALVRNPSYATAHEWYGLFLAAMGRFDEAQAEVRRALELDPLSLGVAGTVGWVLHYSGKQAEAEQQLRIALRTDSNFAIGHLYLGRVLQFQGHYDSALAHFEATGSLRTWVPTIAGNGYVYAQQGKRDRALDVRRRLDSLSRTEYVTSYAVALMHAALGQHDSAFTWLDRAVEERTHWLLWLNRDKRWDPIRSDPRFRALIRRVGLPP
jgi:TolB-like protein/Tfp pilus assembly protein PilF